MSEAEVSGPAPAERPRRWRGLLICLGLVLIAVIVVGGVALMPADEPEIPPPKHVPVNVKTWRVEALPELADTFDLTAVVEPAAVVKVAAEVSGRIERLGRRSADRTWRGRVIPQGVTLEEGEPVSAGEPIVHLNKDLLEARFQRAEAQFEYDEREFRRIVSLFERGSTSKTEMDNARTRRDVSKAVLDEAALELERATIVAPISGIMNRLLMEVGEYASSGDPVAEIVDINTVKIVVDVPERDVYYVHVGQTAEISVRAPQERKLTGEITYISELAEENTRTTRLEITVDNRQPVAGVTGSTLLRSGQIVRARLTRRVLTDVIMIPLGSVIPLERGRVVYLVDADDQAERREVELGFIKGRSVQVLSGLQAGERLIVVGHRYVGPGQPVAVVEQTAGLEGPALPEEADTGASPAVKQPGSVGVSPAAKQPGSAGASRAPNP